MPYIRYEIGDVGSLSSTPCECGRGFPVLNQVLGRNDDFIVKTDGSLVPPRTACLMVRKIPGVREFQIVQDAIDSISISLVVEAGFDTVAIIRDLQSSALQLFSEDMKVSIHSVPSFERGMTGKHRAIKSMVKLT